MEWFTGRGLIDLDKQDRFKEIIMGLFSSKDSKPDTKLKFGETPPKPKLGFTPKKQDKALDKRDKESWRKSRRSI